MKWKRTIIVCTLKMWKRGRSGIPIISEEEYGTNGTVKTIKQYHRGKYHGNEKKLESANRKVTFIL